MNNDFNNAVNFVLSWEGGYENDPKDPGGETNFGICKRYHPAVDIKNLTREGAIDIYYREYWLPFSCNILPWPLCLVHFNCCVNPGIGVAYYLLNKVQDSPDSPAIDQATEYVALLKQHYRDLVAQYPEKQPDLQGWENRANDLLNHFGG